jgi:hypothetical protein
MMISVVSKIVLIKERTSKSTGFKPLASGLDSFLGKHLAKFLTLALEMTYMCDFSGVALVPRKRKSWIHECAVLEGSSRPSVPSGPLIIM